MAATTRSHPPTPFHIYRSSNHPTSGSTAGPQQRFHHQLRPSQKCYIFSRKHSHLPIEQPQLTSSPSALELAQCYH
eukprot:3239421-Pleurochrysis_carterae.AAC.2